MRPDIFIKKSATNLKEHFLSKFKKSLYSLNPSFKKPMKKCYFETNRQIGLRKT